MYFTKDLRWLNEFIKSVLLTNKPQLFRLLTEKINFEKEQIRLLEG